MSGGFQTTLSLFAALALVNAVTFFRFWQDKRRAAFGGWRVSESELLSLAFIGGTPAAFAARHLLRHKTRKQPFSQQLQFIAMLQFGLLAFMIVMPRAG